MKQSLELIRDIQTGLLGWYGFEPKSRVLYVGSVESPVVADLVRRNLQVECISMEESCSTEWIKLNCERFQYIIAITALEKSSSPKEVLQKWRKLLTPGGRLLLGMNNRLGLRYFCGDRDIYTSRIMDSVDGYGYCSSVETDSKGRMYSCAEIKILLNTTGWTSFRFFSVLPDLDNASLIFAEDYLPKEDLGNRVFPLYNYPDTVFLPEETLYESIVGNNMFHAMANAYLIECSPSGRFSEIKQITCSMERGRKFAMFTIVHNDGIVEKRAAWPEGQRRLERLIAHGADLEAHGISVVKARLENGRYLMPYIDSEIGQIYLKRLLMSDKDAFLKALDDFWKSILNSSEHEVEDCSDGEGVILQKGYVDMIPLNSFFREGKFMFYDQEFCIEHFPANGIMIRAIYSFYAGNPELQRLMPVAELLDRYGLMAKKGKWENLADTFIRRLRKQEVLKDYRNRHQRIDDNMNANRWRMNYSETEYRKRFVDTFEYIGNRNLILFGSGKIANRFVGTYATDYPVYAIVDNDEKKWGTDLHGVAIQSPELLTQLQPGTYHVVVCIRDCMPIIRQLEGMGVMSYCVFEPSRHYRRKRRPILVGAEQKPKKYHVGYVAGVFDLFHIGHLNLLRRAKEQCDYLIVGVVTDRQARESKKLPPFIPFEERVKLVEACRYVDEVREIPYEHPDTDMAWQMYHFDVQFSGSDYEHDSVWLAKKKFLEERGSTMVFFPYTESTSSTKLKKLIEQKLL